jgi:DNA-binding transcriptional regulator YbjK
MLEYVEKKAEYARRRGSLYQTQAFAALIQPNGLDNTLNMLYESAGNTNNDIVMLQSQYANWKRSRDLNIVSPEQLQRELNRMTLAVIDYIDNLPV